MASQSEESRASHLVRDDHAYGFRDIRIDRRHGPGNQRRLNHLGIGKSGGAETPSSYWTTAVADRDSCPVSVTVDVLISIPEASSSVG